MQEDQSECMIDKDVYRQFVVKQHRINTLRDKIDATFFDTETQQVPEERMGEYKEALDKLKQEQRNHMIEMWSSFMSEDMKK